MSTAINLIDGIDGLASGLSLIALAFYSFVFFQAKAYIYAILAGSTIGAIIPFFYWNVFGKASRHTKIFMGDTGSLTIGLLLSFFSVEVFNLNPTQLATGENILVIALAPIMLPCFDVVRVFFHRIRRGNNPFLPDKCHIHHKFLALGFKQWQALITILALDAIMISINLGLSPYISPTWIVLIDTAGWIVLNMALTSMIRARERRIGEKLYS